MTDMINCSTCWFKIALFLFMTVSARGYLFKSTSPRVLHAGGFTTRRQMIQLPKKLSPQSSLADFKMELAVPKAKAPRVTVLEDATPVHSNNILEFYHDNDVKFGNFISISPISNAITVRLYNGRVATIDVAQIVCVWDGVADEFNPTTTKEWKDVLEEAKTILSNTPDRKRDLGDFWELASHQRSKNMAVDSFDVGVYLFQESKMRAWMSPMWEASQSKVCALSAAERAAAAMLMHRDNFHFKRRVSTLASPSTPVGDSTISENDEREAEMYVIEGGYKLVTESVLDYKECETFVQYYLAQTADCATKPPVDTNSVEWLIINRIPCTLETYALGKPTLPPSPTVTNPFTGKVTPRRGVPTVPIVPKAVRSVLNRLRLPVTTQSARAVLMNLGKQGTLDYAPTFKKWLDAPREDILKGKFMSDGKVTSTPRTADSGPVGEGYVHDLTPWSSQVTSETQALAGLAEMMREELNAIKPVTAGRRGPSGHMDYRLDSEAHPALCIDTKFATFYDDAFSLSPETGEILIHVVDVVERLSDSPAIQQIIKERVATTFLPTGPLHMLPPAVLDTLKLSTTECNEVLTVGVAVDYETGEILSYRVFPSILGPVFPLDLGTANELIAGVGVGSSAHGSMDVMGDDEYVCESDGKPDEWENGVGSEGGKSVCHPVGGDVDNCAARRLHIPCLPITGTTTVTGTTTLTSDPSNSFVPYIARDFGAEWSARPGIPTNVTRDLRVLHHLTAKMCARYHWLTQPAPKDGKQFVGFSTPRTSAIREKMSSAYSHKVINTLLTLYSQLSVQFCEDKGLSVPVAYSNRDRKVKSLVRRFATQPLRNWLAQLQQRQIRAALKIEKAISQKDCALAVKHYNQKRADHKRDQRT